MDITPVSNDLEMALEVITAFKRHITDLLQTHKLMDKFNKGYPFTLQAKQTHGGLSYDLYLAEKPEYIIDIRPYDWVIDSNSADERLVKNCKLLLEHKNKPLFDKLACCPVAEQQNCVCYVSYSCPIHGNHCIGSHD